MATEFKTPVGRFVQGDLYKKQEKDGKGKPYVVKTGPNAGQPNPQAFFAVAVEKMVRDPQSGQMIPNPDWTAYTTTLWNEARTGGYANCFDPQTGAQIRNFAWKYIDGDGRDDAGRPWSEREGFAGCWVIRFSGSFLPQIVHNGQIIATENYIQRGSYVQVVGNCTCNIGSDKPGLYVNAQAVMLVGYGKPIVGGIDAVAAFAGQPSQYVPLGMSSTPLAGQMPNVAQPPGMTMQQPPGMGTPNHGFVNAAIGLPATLKPTALAQGHSLEAWKANYTEDVLIQNGIFTR